MQFKLLVGVVAWSGLISMGAAQPASSVWGSVGMSGTTAQTADLAVYDDGSGAALYACGYRYGVGHGVWRWSGSTWTNVGLASSWCNALGVYDDGTGSRLYLAGQFTSIDGVPASRVASWDGTAWSPLGAGLSGGSTGTKPYALTVFDDGAGPVLFVGGEFDTAGGVSSACVARWDGTVWSAPLVAAPFTNFSGAVRAFAIHDDGTGPALYCGGYFGVWISGNLTRSVLRYDGVTWGGLGPGLMFGSQGATVHALASFDEGAGPRLFAGGRFDTAPGCTLTSLALARWDGTCWSGVGGGVGGSSAIVTALTVFDDGGGPALYVGGKSMWWAGSPSFTVNMIARWRSGAFEALGGGIYSNLTAQHEVNTYQSFDDGSGLDLYVAGQFTKADFIDTGCIARFGGRSPTVQLSQPAGPGGPVLIIDQDFMPGREYYNIFSLETCAGPPGTGPYIGLCATYVQGLLDQFLLPVGIPPFHFVAAERTPVFGPFALPAGIAIDCVCFDWTHQQPVAISPVSRLLVQ